MRRREFIGILGSVAAWPLTVRAQQRMPVIGLLSSRGPNDAPHLLAAFHKGLKVAGFVEGQNVAIEYRFAENQTQRLPALAADLVHRQVTVIAALNTPCAIAAKAATKEIPIVFEMGSDPILLDIVASLSRPGGNVTGVTQLNVEVGPKRLELLHELIPTASVVALLVNPNEPHISEIIIGTMKEAAQRLGLKLHILNATAEGDFDGVFAKMSQLRAGGLVIGGGPFLIARQEHLATLALSHRVPAVFETREFVAAGGLMSYGGDITEAYRLAGVYTARILKGEKPSQLAVHQSTKVEMLLNLKTAKALGIEVPNTLIGRADEVIE